MPVHPSVSLYIHLYVFMTVHMTISLYIHPYVYQYIWAAIHPSISPLGHMGYIYVSVRHPAGCQYNDLFIYPVVVCRLTIVYRVYLSVHMYGWPTSTWMVDHLGIQGVVGFTFHTEASVLI